MPRSRRAQVVPLTQTGKRTSRDTKNAHIETIATALSTHSHALLFRVKNFRTAVFQDFRQALKELEPEEPNGNRDEDNKPVSRVFFGKNSLLQRALQEHSQTGISESMAALVSGPSVGLLCTDAPIKAILEAAQSFSGAAARDFARAGCIATETITIPAGTLHQYYDPAVLISTTCEAQIKFSGMGAVQREVSTGGLSIPQEHCICREGDRLSVDQAKLLRIFGVMMAEMSIVPLASCDLRSGAFELLLTSVEDASDGVEGGSDQEMQN